ncbi:MAG: DUF4097 family beta strand repeat-containing protein [Candidatus Marinimicrobia bacterium]|nr:DUF4097 family beta strand repeat-containing protein [Candidatus Neomarinimicrobiota bacterium]
MYKFYKILLTFLATSWLLAQNPTVLHEGGSYIFTWSEKVQVDDLPSQLTMNHLNGDVLIRGQESETIRYIEKIQIRADSQKEANNLWDDYHYALEEDKNGYVVNRENRKNFNWDKYGIRVEYIVDVPFMTSIAVSTLGGDIHISDIQGAVELVSAGGDVHIEDILGRVFSKTYGGDTYAYHLEGKIEINSAGGDIDLRILTGDISVETGGGDIEMREINGNLDVVTMGGDIELSEMKGLKTRLTTMGGDIEVEACESEIYVETKGGDINLRDISGFTIGKTYGGDISATNINGSATLETLSGDIKINRIFGAIDVKTQHGSIFISKYFSSALENHSILASSRNGDVTLELYQNPDATFNLTTRGYENKIVSDFPLVTISSNPSRKTMSGTSGKGTYPIDIYVENGNILLSKRNQ